MSHKLTADQLVCRKPNGPLMTTVRVTPGVEDSVHCWWWKPEAGFQRQDFSASELKYIKPPKRPSTPPQVNESVELFLSGGASTR